jgi:hypothetical protein
MGAAEPLEFSCRECGAALGSAVVRSVLGWLLWTG